MAKRILVGVPPKAHVILALDEVQGLTDIGYCCKPITYGRNNQSLSKFNKLIGVIENAFKIILSLYKFTPDVLYLNSRLEPVASSRDFISILIFKTLYWRELRIVIKSHGSNSNLLFSTKIFYKKILVPFMVKYVDAWFFLSKEEIEVIKQYAPELTKKIFLTSNVIDPKRSVRSLDFKKKYDLDNDKFKFLFIGRIVKEKGVFSFLKSIPYLNFKDKCLFIFVGDGPDLNELKSLSISSNISQYVRFLGYIPEHECDHFYANTDALVFPTFDNEGFPMALFKSVASGLPIITTKVRAAKDHLISPDNVLWVEGESEFSIVHAISIIYENKELRSLMAKNNIKIGGKFNRKDVCKEMSKVLEKF